MKLHYKSLLLSTITAIILTACGGGGSDSTPDTSIAPDPTPITESTTLAKAQLGALSGATVEIHELGVTPYKLLYTETTSAGDSVEKTGNFDSHHDSLEDEKFYLYTVSNGLDVDANDDGVMDAIPTVNNGSFHAIVQGKSVKKVKGDFKVTIASELLYQKVKADIDETTQLEEKLSSSAKEIFQKGIDDDIEITNEDILQYNPVEHKEVFQEAYQEKLPEIIKDIHDDKKELEKLAPTANAGVDKSIMIGEDITLTANGLDLDGKIISYSWVENGDVLSEKQRFTYAPNSIGLHTLTLTVTDNDNLNASDRINITVSEQPNTPPTARSKSIYVSEDTKQSFDLEGSDKEGDTLTYKVLTTPVYGQLSGKAPSLSYTPNANFNGDDRVIFVTNDGKADSQKAIVKIYVEPSNDNPEILFDGDSISTKEDTAKRFTLKAEDQEKDTLTYTITQKPKFGTLTHKKDSFTYTPKENFNGNDSFIVTVEDGNGGEDSKEITIQITPVNDAPTMDIGESKSMLAGESLTLRANAKDIDGKVVKYAWYEDKELLSSQATLVYTQEEVGSHTITLTITDDKGATTTDRVVIHVAELPNVKPKAENISIKMKEDTTTNITLKASDDDEDILTYKIVQNPTHGTISGTIPNIAYSPVKDYFGIDNFTFRANDGKDDSNVAKVTITIEDVIEADKVKPIITLHGTATITVIQGKKYTELGATATDDRDGTVTVKRIGTVTTTKVGTYTVTYTATDKAGNKATKTRTVKVVLPKDIVKPVITLNGATTITVIQGKKYTELGATATDDRDGTVTVKTTVTVTTIKVGTYTVTYTATDKAGNKATKTRTVKVVIAPTIKKFYSATQTLLRVMIDNRPEEGYWVGIFTNDKKNTHEYLYKTKTLRTFEDALIKTEEISAGTDMLLIAQVFKKDSWEVLATSNPLEILAKPTLTLSGPKISRLSDGNFKLVLYKGEVYPVSNIKTQSILNNINITVEKNTPSYGNLRTDRVIKKTYLFSASNPKKSTLTAEVKLEVDVIENPLSLMIIQKLGQNSYPSNFTTVGNKTYFTANMGNDINLYITDGTSGGTRFLERLGDKLSISTGKFMVINGSLFFDIINLVYNTKFDNAYLMKATGDKVTVIDSMSTQTYSQQYQMITLIRDENDKLLYRIKGDYYLYNPSTGSKTVFNGVI